MSEVEATMQTDPKGTVWRLDLTGTFNDLPNGRTKMTVSGTFEVESPTELADEADESEGKKDA